MKGRFILPLIFFLILSIKCTGDNSANPEETNSKKENQISEHFSFVLYDGLSETVSTPILNKLEENYTRVLSDLNLNTVNKVTVKIWNDETHFQNDMLSALGVKYPGATGYVTSSSEVRVLNRGNLPQNVLHEFCHIASIAVNNRISNNPRWLWEAVAIYEAGEFRDPKTINYLVAGNYPTISEMNSDYNAGNYKIYEVGYLLSEYIVTKYGQNTFVNLIRSNGNIQQTLEVTVQQFEEGWKQFVQTKYF